MNPDPTLNFTGHRNWSMPIYNRQGAKFTTDSLETGGINVTVTHDMILDGLRISSSAYEPFQGCTLKVLNHRNAVVLNASHEVIGGIFSSRESTKLAVQGSELDVHFFFRTVNTMYA